MKCIDIKWESVLLSKGWKNVLNDFSVVEVDAPSSNEEKESPEKDDDDDGVVDIEELARNYGKERNRNMKEELAHPADEEPAVKSFELLQVQNSAQPTYIVTDTECPHSLVL